MYLSPSLNDKDDKNDKESEKSPMRVIGRGLWKPCHSCHSCHGKCGQSIGMPTYNASQACRV